MYNVLYTLTISVDLLQMKAMGPLQTNFSMKLIPINNRRNISIVRYTYT